MHNFKFSRFLLLAVLCAALMCLSAFAASVVYVADGGSGNGSSASVPVGTLTDAFNALGDDGGTVVVCGVCTISEQFVEPTHTGKVTITSKYGNTDYATKKGAAIEFFASYILTGDTEFKNITLRSCNGKTTTTYPYYSIMARANKITIGSGVVSELGDNCDTHLSLIGGSSAVYKNKTGNVVISSGTWQRVRGGATKSGGTNYNVNVIINGGTFLEAVVLSSATASGACSHSGNINATINGGTFVDGVYLTAHRVDTDVFTGDATLSINGGTFYESIALSATGLGTHNCSFDVVLNGGEYQHLHEINGGCDLDGTIASSFICGENVDFTASESGEVTFKNFLRRNNADPFMFYHDGYYYYTATGAASVSLIKVRNIADIQTVNATKILTPNNYTDLWSPEIHYFTADEIGEEYAGWYMFVGAKEKDSTGSTASNQRQYVVKCLDGDNLLGRWGDPVTGEANVLRKMTFATGGYNEDALCGGSSPIRINGKLYLTFVSEEGRGTSEFHQTINITTLETPWNITGTPVEICRPDYDWEKHGYWYGANSDGAMTWWPQVVEGASAVYAPTGEVYLMYTGSGYWTTWYALGYLKLVGNDPLKKSSWQKNPTPVLQREETLTESSINGCGHGSYFTDHAGQMWVAYHGYIGVDTSSKRFSFVEPIYVTANGVTIGNGSGHPASLDTVYTINANPVSLSAKTSGFNTATARAISDINEGVTILYGPVEDTLSYIVRRDSSTGKLIYGGTDLSCVDTGATPGTHTYYIMATKRGNDVISQATVTAVARNNLRFKDVDKNGKFDIVDMMMVLRDILNENKYNAKLTDVIQMIKCI